MESRDYRLTVSLNDLRSYDGELATLLLKKPLEMLPPLEEVSKDISHPLSNSGLRFLNQHVALL